MKKKNDGRRPFQKVPGKPNTKRERTGEAPVAIGRYQPIKINPKLVKLLRGKGGKKMNVCTKRRRRHEGGGRRGSANFIKEEGSIGGAPVGLESGDWM